MPNSAHHVLSNRILRVEAGAPLRRTRVAKRTASHAAIFAGGDCLGVSSLDAADLPSHAETYGDLVGRQQCLDVPETVTVEELGRLFEDEQIETLIVRNDQGQFVGAVTRQSLLDGLLQERTPTEELPPSSSQSKTGQPEKLLAGERQFLECLLTADSPDGGLTELIEVIESLSDGMICAILLMDDDGKHLRSGASISLPEEFVCAVDGLEVGPNAGCCGTAAFLKQPVIVSDIANDPLWEGFRDLASKHGLRSCWSLPILSAAGKVLGTFAMYYHEPRIPDAHHERLIERAVHLAAIAIERQNVETSLRRSEQRLSRAQQIAHVGSFELDSSGTPTYWSDECFRIFGLEPGGELPTRSYFVDNVIHPDDCELSRQIVEQAIQDGTAFNYEYRVRRPDGSVRWVHTVGQPVCDDSGQVVSVEGTIFDITGRKISELKLLESERKFHTMFDSVPECVKLLDADGNLLDMNAAGLRLIEADSMDQVRGVSVYQLVTAEHQQEFEKNLRAVFAGESNSQLFEIVGLQGTRRWMETYQVPLRDERGEVASLLAVTRDVTDRKRADELLKGLVEGTSSATGAEFFSSFATTLARVFQSRYVLVCEHLDDPVTRVRTLAFWMGDQLVDEIQYDLAGGPCELTAAGEATFYPRGVQSLFPEDTDLVDMSAESYCGIPLTSSSGDVIGHMAILDDRPMNFNLCDVPTLQFFVSRAAAELERKRTENALRASELRLQTVISDAPVVILSVDLTGEINLFDGRGLDSVGIQRGQFVGVNYFELWSERPYMTGAMRKCLAGEIPEPTRMDISNRLLETRYSPIMDAEGNVSGAISVCVDITEQIQAENQIREKNSVLEGITHLQRDFLVDMDPYQSFDQILNLLIELTSSEYGFIAEVLHCDDGKPYLKTYALTNIAWDDATRAYFDEHAPTGLEFANLETLFGAVLKTGEIVVANDAPNDPRASGIPPGHPPMNNFAGLPFFHAGELVGVIGLANRAEGYDDQIIETLAPILSTCASLAHSYHLVRRRQQAENSLRDSETRSRSMLEGSPVCTKIVDLESRLQYMSRAGQKMLKINDIESFYGSPFPPKLYPQEWRLPVKERLERAKRGEITNMECPVLDTEGNEIWFDTTFVPAHNDDGRIEHIIVTSVNITERRQAEEDARRHRNELAHVSRVSTMGEMATGIAHELNQPLAAIAAYSETAKLIAEQQAPAADDLPDVLGKLKDQAIRAGEIVKRIRSYVKKSEPVRTRVNLHDFVRTVANFVDPDVLQAGVSLKLQLEQPSCQLQADEIQLQQVLVNLIRNAIDAMQDIPAEQRALTIASRIREDGQAEVSVRDAGNGLPIEFLSHVFEAFYTTKTDGMGMGLPISRSIIESHGGKLWVKPNERAGMTFGFSIPCNTDN